jgi:uncharacterized membrane protein
VVFAVQRANLPIEALGYGALFGLIAYATYDLTNLATLKGFSLKVTMIDLAWGSFISGTTAFLTYLIYSFFSL